ncbi:hypothetical protein RA2_02287 [Roseovarius sp. A-2]|uniref:hypothetical protein n=1 Tax=Roseovarius sp. A-2 TaxID=1570360 RepID=UPI0009B4FECC|nr:hypothetical protein [Roseovarius sp. A-2]GAW35227.1 hypothetical protein RA2_02287 [Roseovarius sp. A-2]
MHAFQYNSLGDINDVEMLVPEDEAVLSEIRDILIKHGKLHKFGVNLLHRHFDLAADECLVEYTDVDQRILKSVVEKRGQTAAVETMWRFDTDSAGMCVSFCTRTCSTWGSHHTHHQKTGHIDRI